MSPPEGNIAAPLLQPRPLQALDVLLAVGGDAEGDVETHAQQTHETQEGVEQAPLPWPLVEGVLGAPLENGEGC